MSEAVARFVALVRGPEPPLDEAALALAAGADPDLDPAPWLAELDRLAAGVDSLPALIRRLFVEEGFTGNSVDYADPRNSLLPEVLTRRTGIPITLAIVYLEVAGRAGVSASPVGFPGHFLVCLDIHAERLAIDPFDSGTVLDDRGLAVLLRRSGSQLSYAPELIAATPVRQVLARMLMNLRSIYAQRGELSRLLVVFDRLIDLLPGAAEERRDRGLLFGRLGAPDAALADLERYLELAPEAADAAQVRQWLLQMQRASQGGSVRS